MARSAGSSRGGGSQTKDFNAQQAQKRRSAKGKDGPTDIADVYDFAVSQNAKAKGGRAARRAAYHDREEELETNDRKEKGRAQEDDEEDEEDDQDEDGPRPIGPDVFDSDDEINTGINGSDEEIDSDEAFGESDEERFIDFKFASDAAKMNKKKTKKAPGRKEVNLDEDESEEEDEDEDEDGELVDLSRMLDSASEPELGSSSDDDMSQDDDDDDDDVADKLRSQIDSFTAKRTAESSDDEAAPQTKRARRVLAEQTAAAQEGEFASSGGAGLRLKDFMAPLSGQIDFADVRRSTKALEKGKSGGAASKKGGGALAAPLPTALQEKLDRQAALKLTKGEVQGWEPTLRHIRDAEQLSFPLQKPEVVKRSTAGMVADFKPTTEMEDAVANMLTEGGMTEKQLAQQEDLAMNHLDPEEVKARRAELRRMRDLMFRAEQKAKRVSKIKSKAYRKVQRKEKERLKEKMKELGMGEDEEEDIEAEEGDEERMRAERLRAEERATLRHKNTGKWAKGVAGGRHGEETKEARDALEEQLRRGEQLRRRIHGKGSDSESAESSDDGSDGEDDGNAKEQAFDELATLEAKENARRERDEAEMERVGGKKGVYNMKFMKDARERENQRVRGIVDDFKDEMENMGVEAEEGQEATPTAYVGGNKGRAVYGSGTVQPAASTEEPQQPEQQLRKEKKASSSSDPLEVGGSATIKKTADQDDANPWLTAPSETGKISKKKNEILVGKGSNTAVKSANRTSKHKAKGWEAVEAAKRDEELEIDPSARLDEDEPVAITGKGVTAFQQRDLVAQAFAHDDVAAEFAAEKAAIMASEAPKEVDTTLPGWGAWGGKGARPSGAQRRRKQQIAGLDPSKRKDAKMDNVLINEKKDKKADHFTVKDLPHPFTSRAQYEMAMRNPLGPEWNTRIETQRLTAPKVLKKMGKVIKPIERKF